MADTFTIQELLADAFRVGRAVQAFPAPAAQAQPLPEGFPQLPVLAQDAVQGYSQHTGLPFFDYITFIPQDYSYIDDRGNIVTGVTPLVTLPCALIDLTRVKLGSLRQPMQRNGTVKEYAAHGDWQVQIRTAILNLKEPHRYPKAEVEALLAVCRCPNSIRVEGPMMTLFKINALYIETENWANRERLNNVQLVTLNCLSDTPPNLEPEP